MGRKFDYDYIIIGSGPAGRAAALKLAKAKKHIALVEGGEFGGSQLNTRDIPYSINLDFAHNYAKLKSYPALAGQDFHYNFPTVVSHTEHIVTNLRAAWLQNLKDAGVDYIEGFAHFLDGNTIAVHGTEYTATNFILATGSRLNIRNITGLDTVNYLTPDTAMKVRRLPKYVFVVGGGSTGCELASYFAELGTKVILMERSSRLLPREDKEVSAAIQQHFTDELGIQVITNAKVVAIEQDNISKRVIFNSAGQEKLVRVDCIVMATGSAPAVDYGLENAGVKFKSTGIVVDKFFQTSAHNIYAIGDAIAANRESSTERAEYEGNLLAESLIHHVRVTPVYAGCIREVATFPAVATVGLNEYDLLSSDHRYKKSTIHPDGNPNFFIKLLTDQNDKLLGATIVAPDARLIASKFALAIRHRIKLTKNDLH